MWKIIAAATLIASTSAAPPATVSEHVNDLKQVNRVSSLPPAIRAGRFIVDGVSAKGWKMAEPGGPFNATDVPVGDAPGRRLIFAACDPHLCLIHYERGGVAHFYEVLAVAYGSNGWTAIWNVRGPKPIASFDSLRRSIERERLEAGWSEQPVKGDF